MKLKDNIDFKELEKIGFMPLARTPVISIMG